MNIIGSFYIIIDHNWVNTPVSVLQRPLLCNSLNVLCKTCNVSVFAVNVFIQPASRQIGEVYPFARVRVRVRLVLFTYIITISVPCLQRHLDATKCDKIFGPLGPKIWWATRFLNSEGKHKHDSVTEKGLFFLGKYCSAFTRKKQVPTCEDITPYCYNIKCIKLL